MPWFLRYSRWIRGNILRIFSHLRIFKGYKSSKRVAFIAKMNYTAMDSQNMMEANMQPERICSQHFSSQKQSNTFACHKGEDVS